MQPERRKSDREAAGISASCRVRGIAYRATLSDVSAQGCCCETASRVARPGERVLLQLGRHMTLPATVRWVADRRAGLELGNPLHGTMLAQFARRQANGTGRDANRGSA